jgi:hypothetical protein
MQRSLLLKAEAPVEVAAPIVVPDANLTGEDDGISITDPNSNDLIEAIKGGGVNPGSNPLLPTQKIPE